ncbi:hypothetical protein FJZ19_05165 [Candidatus Pacearchaeota archaeon]|nr:hypothetical protein [Candidatus Pacearchaeota archaeon]
MEDSDNFTRNLAYAGAAIHGLCAILAGVWLDIDSFRNYPAFPTYFDLGFAVYNVTFFIRDVNIGLDYTKLSAAV